MLQIVVFFEEFHHMGFNALLLLQNIITNMATNFNSSIKLDNNLNNGIKQHLNRILVAIFGHFLNELEETIIGNCFAFTQLSIPHFFIPMFFRFLIFPDSQIFFKHDFQ